MTNHDYGGINIPGNKGAFAIGQQNTVNQNNSGAANDVTEELIELLKGHPEIAPEKKEELEEIISSASEEIKAEKPKKAILKSLLDSANSIMSTIAKTPELITAFDKWSDFIKPFIGS